VEANQIRGNRQDGVRVVSEAADTAVRGNVIAENARYGVYVDTSGAVDVTGNTVVGNRAGIVSRDTAAVPDGANTVRDNAEADVLVD
jgi:parallel beta-helix repeat protein